MRRAAVAGLAAVAASTARSTVASPLRWQCRSSSSVVAMSSSAQSVVATANGVDSNDAARSKAFREFEVPVPWGVIAGKEWGSSTGFPWLVLHGWLDNCGSFDTLAPLFPDGHRLLCIDVPGHGHSSHYPEGFVYHYMDGLQYIRRVSAHVLGPNVRFGLMGHSMGGGMSAMFAATHPDHVAALVLLDCVKPISRRMETIVDRTRSAVDEHMAFETKMAKARPPVYTYEDAKKRLLDSAIQIHGKHVITEQSADILLKRGLKESDCGSGFTYTRDIRHRVSSLYGYPNEVMLEFASRLRCPTLIVKAEHGSYYEPKENADEVVAVYAKNCQDFEFVEVPGSHHVHLNEPEVVFEHIQKFLDRNAKAFDTKSAQNGSKI